MPKTQKWAGKTSNKTPRQPFKTLIKRRQITRWHWEAPLICQWWCRAWVEACQLPLRTQSAPATWAPKTRAIIQARCHSTPTLRKSIKNWSKQVRKPSRSPPVVHLCSWPKKWHHTRLVRHNLCILRSMFRQSISHWLASQISSGVRQIISSIKTVTVVSIRRWMFHRKLQWSQIPTLIKSSKSQIVTKLRERIKILDSR